MIVMPDSLYGARLQGFTVVVFIVAKSRAWFDEYIYHDSLQARAIEGIGHLAVTEYFQFFNLPVIPQGAMRSTAQGDWTEFHVKSPTGGCSDPVQRSCQF